MNTAVAQRGSLRLVVLVALAAGCAARTPIVPEPRIEPLRLGEVQLEGDAVRRASMALVLEGLDADERALPDVARDRFRRSLQVDPGNPYAYLAFARHQIDGVDPASAIAYVDKAEALMRLEGQVSPGARAHLAGLRGAALQSLGRHAEARALLADARRLAPGVWSDGRLDPRELR